MRQRNRNILIILTAVVVVAAIFSSFGLSIFNSQTPSIVLPTPGPAETGRPGDIGPEQGTRVEIAPDTVQSVILAMNRLESYARTVTTVLEGTSVTAQVWEDGGWTRTALRRSNGRTEYTIVGGDSVWRWYDGDSTAVSWAADSSSGDLEGQRIPTYEDVLALDKRDITAAGYVDKEGSPCVYVEVAVSEPDQIERYWVSAYTGLLTYAETEAGGAVVWSMSSTIPEIPAPAGSFALPDGTVLHRVGE